jgi:DNA topoisomerase IA
MGKAGETKMGKYYVFSDNFMEKLTPQSLIAPINIDTRRDFIVKNSQEFQIPIVGKYRGTEKQNTALLKFLKESPDFRKKWESELLNIKNTTEQKKTEIAQPRMEFGKNITPKEGTRLHGVTTSAYTHSEDPRW